MECDWNSASKKKQKTMEETTWTEVIFHANEHHSELRAVVSPTERRCHRKDITDSFYAPTRNDAAKEDLHVI